jgi:hypothetical protein
MHESASAQIELLTDELRQLVGRGTNPMRLVTLPTLRSLAVGESSRLTGLDTQVTGSPFRSGDRGNKQIPC